MLYVLPLLAVLVLGVSLFFAAGQDEIRAALVLGGPTDSDAPFRGRLHLIHESLGAAAPLANETVLLRASQGSHEFERRITTDEEGWSEFELPLAAEPEFKLVVSDTSGRVLAEGAPDLATRRWSASARRRGGEGGQHKSGDLGAQLVIPDRILGVPFAAEVKVVVTFQGNARAGAQITLSGAGAEVIGKKRGQTDAAGMFSFRLRPDQHVASLDVTVEFEGERLRFDQRLPVVPGAYGYKREGDTIRVLAPIPREEVWFTFVREAERLGGGRVSLTENKSGGSEGVIPAN
jgi:hypothetical protein